MKILFYDDSNIYVTKDQGERVKQAIMAGTEWIEIDNSMYAVKSIKSVMDDKPVGIDTPLLPPPTTELSEEQRLKNLETIRKMKANFFSRRGIVQ